MPKIFEYLGIVLFFYSNEHEPIHVHASYDSFESKAEFYIVNGEISEIRIKLIKDRKTLKGAKLKDFEKFLEVYADKIVQKWIDYLFITKRLTLKELQIN